MVVWKIEIRHRKYKMENSNYQPIKNYKDLRSYQNLYKVMVLVHKEIILSLPQEEKCDLVN